MSEVRVNNLTNENNTGGPTISGITTYSGRHFFVPPQGDTASRPENCEPGSLRFNTDTSHLEYFRGNTLGWTEIEAELTAPLGGGSGSNEGVGFRALFGGGGNYGSYVNDIKFLTISTLGDSEDFGNMSYNAQFPSTGASSRTRGLFAGGYAGGRVNTIEFVTIASKGDTTDFGDMTHKRETVGAGCNGTRCVMGGGWYNPAATNIIDYVQIATTGDSVDFGDQTATGGGSPLNNTIRLILKVHSSNSATHLDTVVMSTTGNAGDFGDTTTSHTGSFAGATSSTRGIYAGQNGPLNTMDFITMATFGDAIDFGDLTVARGSLGGTSSPTRGVFYGGAAHPSSTELDVIDYVEIATTGNALDFGDAETARRNVGALSNGHGGL